MSGLEAPPANEPTAQEIKALVALFSAGRYAQAAEIAKAMTVRFPRHGVGWKALGVAYKQMGRSADSLDPMQKAAALSPGDPEVHNNLGNTLKELGRLDEAEASCRRALELKPNYAEAHNNLGNTLLSLGRPEEAEASYRRALQIKPDYAEAHNNLGIILKDLGRLMEAEASYRRALEIKPDHAEAHNYLGDTLMGLGRLNEAEASYRRALEIRPDFADAHNNLGNPLRALGRLDEAEASCRRALQIKPEFAEAYCNLGNVLRNLGRQLEAEASYRRALDINPDHLVARVAQMMTALPIAPQTVAESISAPSHFDHALEDFADWLRSTSATPGQLSDAAGSHQPFYLAYRDGNHLALLSRYGDLIAEGAGKTQISTGERRTKLRLAIVSAQFRRHSVWDVIVRGLLANLDRTRFELALYHVGHFEDQETEYAKSLADTW